MSALKSRVERLEQSQPSDGCDCCYYEVEYPETGVANPAPATCPHGRPWSHLGTIAVIYDDMEPIATGGPIHA
jgi:hypothetical protein